MTPAVEAREISKQFGQLRALCAVSFSAAAGEVHALCGENGAGKSTLVKILTGVLQPDSGNIVVNGEAETIPDPQRAQSLKIGYVSQELSIALHLSVFDNVWLGCSDVPFFHRRDELRERARLALNLVGLGYLPLEKRASALALGEQQLVEIARMLVRDVQVLILDEPTATLSDNEIECVFAAIRELRSKGKTVIYITHRLGEVMSLCDRVTVLRNGESVMTADVADVTRERLVESMLGRSISDMYPQGGQTITTGELSVRGLWVPGRVYGLDFTVSRGQILCLAGQMGSGATDAIRALAGLVYSATGSVSIDGKRLKLGSVRASLRRNVRFVSEDRAGEGLFLNLSVAENFVATQLRIVSRYGLLFPASIRDFAMGLANTVTVNAARLKSRCGDLSGGNQQKIAIGRSVTAGFGILLMNEPTRGVDVGARAEIYSVMRNLCDQGYIVVMTSTDIEEVVGLSDVVITMYRGEGVAVYERDEISAAQIVLDITHPISQTANAA